MRYIIHYIWYIIYHKTWYVTLWYGSMVWYGMVWWDILCHDVIWYDLIWHDLVWRYGMIWYGIVWFDMIWRDMIWGIVLSYGMTWYQNIWSGNMEWYGMVLYMIWYGKRYLMIWSYVTWYDLNCGDMNWYDMIWIDMVWNDMMWYGMVWYDIVWCVMRCDMMRLYMMWYHVMWVDMIWYGVVWIDVFLFWRDIVWRDMTWYDIWHVICDIWFMFYDVWYVICDIWYARVPAQEVDASIVQNAVKAHRAEHLQSVVTCGNDTQTKRCKTHPKTVLVPCFQKTSRSMHPWAMALTSSKALKLLNNTSGEMKTSHDTQCLWNPLIVVQGCPGNLFLKLSFHKCSRKLKRAVLSSCISLATKGQLPAKWHLSAVEGPELLVAFLFSVPFLCLSPVLPRDVRCRPKPGHPVLTCADWHNVSTNYHPGSSAKAEGETSPDCILCNSMHCSCRICVMLDIYLISLHDIKCTVWP